MKRQDIPLDVADAPLTAPQTAAAPAAGNARPDPGRATPLTDRLDALTFLYLAAAALAALALLPPAWPGSRPVLSWSLALTAAGVGGALWLLRRRGGSLGLLGLGLLAAFGTTLVTMGVYAAGPHAAPAASVLYVLPAGYVAYALPRRWALAVIAYGGLSLGAVLWSMPLPWAFAEWVLVTGTAAVAAMAVSRLSQQAHRRYAAERDLAHTLQQTEATRTGLLRAARHDLGTPLTVVLGLLQTVHDHLDDLTVPTNRELLERAIANVHALWRIIDDLPDQAEAGEQLALRRERVELSSLTQRVLHALGDQHHPLQATLEPVVVAVDPRRLERVIQNLLVNAMTHTAPGVPVAVGVHAVGGGALLTVEDAGAGVPDAMKEMIFEPFVRQAAGGETVGSGLGLSVVRQFVRAHGGDVWVEDRAGGGARFVVHLPG